jgi:predicted RND superfamily exporter protein
MFLKIDESEVSYYDGGRVRLQDPVVMAWEGDVSCYLGFEEDHPTEDIPCGPASGLTYNGLLTRSLGDEFGDAVRNDISKITMAYALIVVYLVINLGKRDVVHSMAALSCGSLFCVGASFVSSSGLGAFFGVKTNPLNGNIPFLLLGLGVDDSFVIVSEFLRHARLNPTLSPEEWGWRTARSAGMSVLVTSLTDGLALLVGASTSLPALSAFCIYGGLGVFACFTYMFALFLPLVVVNARRASANRFDCLCCFTSKVDHMLEEPQGCCSCFPPCVRIQPRDGFLSQMMHRWGDIVIKTPAGNIATLVVFVGLLVTGITGLTQIEKDFKLEWFFPPDSYALEYFNLNDKYFSRGQAYTVYAHGIDFYAEQVQLNELAEYIQIQPFTVDGVADDNWYSEFTKGKPQFTDRASFWDALWTWFQATGARYQGSVKWHDRSCDLTACTAVQRRQGIAHAKLFSSTLKKFPTGRERYEVYRTIREDIKEIFNDASGKKVFPFNQQFLFWVETGVIDAELARNLVISFAIICTIIALLIPHPRIAIFVALNIVAAVVEVIGFAHFWGVTMNGVSTIYFLICAGLAVDYSAHIGHVFKDSTGGRRSVFFGGKFVHGNADRAIQTLVRIGPSVFHTIFSTILAVLVLSFSKSFVFVVFFKVLFLICVIAGAHGLWFLPIVLSIVGSEQQRNAPVYPETAIDESDVKGDELTNVIPSELSEKTVDQAAS